VDVWFVEMDDYFHATKVGQNSAVEFSQSYLKGYTSTWWRTVRQKERKTHGYTWEFFKECNEFFISFQKIMITYQGANFVTL
jgi:hypothetical protein